MRVVADSNQVGRITARLIDEAAAAMRASPGPWAIVGVRSRGDVLAQRLAAALKPQYTGSIDIGLYRDDLSELAAQPIVRTTDISFPVDGTRVLLVDDVMMTGRTTRAAIQSLIDFGRPACVRLMVLVDRGGRELPFAPDFVGLRINTDAQDRIVVRLRPTDAEDAIELQPAQTTERPS